MIMANAPSAAFVHATSCSEFVSKVLYLGSSGQRTVTVETVYREAKSGDPAQLCMQ